MWRFKTRDKKGQKGVLSSVVLFVWEQVQSPQSSSERQSSSESSPLRVPRGQETIMTRGLGSADWMALLVQDDDERRRRGRYLRQNLFLNGHFWINETTGWLVRRKVQLQGGWNRKMSLILEGKSIWTILYRVNSKYFTPFDLKGIITNTLPAEKLNFDRR